MTPLVLRHEAEIDLYEAVVYYERRKNGLGRRFLDAVHETFRRIQRRPTLRAPMHADVRRAPVRRFPYGVYFRVEPERLLVVAVLDARRDPSVWQSRVE